ncbi:MAG: cation transporter [Betaproteobacteria bacterium]|nr:cation transporter [Betaproteobacteria bacterium]
MIEAMDDCCTDKGCAVDWLRERQSATLRVALLLNAGMFLVEIVSGWLAGSVALLADSLDMLGDALVYGFSLYVVARGAVWKARAAVAKAAVMGLFGLFVLAQLVYKLLQPQLPAVEAMGAVGALALVANGVCFTLLWRQRAEDINMRSVWLCTRNDLIANVSVLFAALAVWMTSSPWPDVAVGALICAVFLRSAYLVARDARADLRLSHARPPVAAEVPQASRR